MSRKQKAKPLDDLPWGNNDDMSRPFGCGTLDVMHQEELRLEEKELRRQEKELKSLPRRPMKRFQKISGWLFLDGWGIVLAVCCFLFLLLSLK